MGGSVRGLRQAGHPGVAFSSRSAVTVMAGPPLENWGGGWLLSGAAYCINRRMWVACHGIFRWVGVMANHVFSSTKAQPGWVSPCYNQALGQGFPSTGYTIPLGLGVGLGNVKAGRCSKNGYQGSSMFSPKAHNSVKGGGFVCTLAHVSNAGAVPTVAWLAAKVGGWVVLPSWPPRSAANRA